MIRLSLLANDLVFISSTFNQLSLVYKYRQQLATTEPQFNTQHISKVIHVSQLQLLVTGKTEPCFKMDLVHPGLYDALNNFKAGVTCKVLNDADIQIGDNIHITEQLSLF